MANITQQEPIRWQIDQAAFDASGTLTVTDAFDCTTSTSVEGFTITGTEPANTSRRVIFTVDGTQYKLDSSGALVAESDPENGNTVAELEAITTVPGFVGKMVGATIYLYAEDPEGQMPTIGISVKGKSASQQTVKEETSPVYNLGTDAQIIKLEASVTVTNGGTAVVEARINGGAWGTLASFAGLAASSVQFRATLTAPNIGVSSARINQVSVLYRTGNGLVAGVGRAEIVSVTKDWHIGVRECRMNVKHARIIDSVMRAFVSFRDNPQIVQGEVIGVGTGESGTYQLANVTGIKYDSVRLYVNSARVYSGYEVNTQVGRITYTAPVGAELTADYEHGWKQEIWDEMEHNGTVPALDYDTTEFKFVLPIDEDPKSVCTVKIDLEVTDGHIDGESIGIGTDVMHTYSLSHIVKDGKITVYSNGTALPASAWTLSDDAKSVKVAAASGAALTVDYDWISETPEVSQFIAVFAE
jgi:hypothetical protein